MRHLALLVGLLATPLSAQVAPALWDQCIAAPDPACALSLALAEIEADPEMTSRDYRIRVLVELLVAHRQTAAASAALRLMADAGDALRLWPDVLDLRPDPGDLAFATGLAGTIANPSGERAALNNIAKALVRADDLDGARAIIAGYPEPMSDAILVLATAMVRQGDLAGAQTLAASVEETWQDDAQAALILARAQAGDLPGALADWDTVTGRSDRLEIGIGLLPLVATPGHVDTLLGLLTDPFGGQADYFDRLARAFGVALADAPVTLIAPEAGRIAGTDIAPEHRAAILIEVLRATGDPAIATRLLAIADEIADPVVQALVRIDAAPWVDANELAGLADWGNGLALGNRAYVMGELAIASGDAAIARQAAVMLPAYGDEIDMEEAFAEMVAAVAAGAEPEAVADLFAAVSLDGPAHDDAVLAAAGPLAANGQADLALTLARDMTYEERMAVALGRIGASTGDAAVLAEALSVTRAETGNYYRTEALIAIATAMLGDPG
jgi:hypothetical protein